MKKSLTAAAFALPFGSTLAHAQEAGLDQAISDAIAPIVYPIVNTVFYSVPLFGTQFPLIVGWLVVAAVVFTLYFGFIQFRGFKHSIELVRGDYFDPKDAGEVTPFQALATALSGTVGLGNIAGVGVAVYLGGPGATFWMILAGLLGMASKFTECTLGVHYRNEYPDGTVSGGPMYYLSKGLSEDGKAALGKFLAIFFSICCIGGALGGGNMFQANQSFAQVSSIIPFFEGKGWLFGLIMAVVVGVVIIGGIKSIAKVTEKVVPFMAVIYVAAALVIILMNIGAVPAAIGAIISGAFAPTAVAGGMIGALIQGFKRAALLERGRHRLRLDRPLCRADPAPGHRGLCRPARTLHRHGGHLHHDLPGDRDHRCLGSGQRCHRGSISPPRPSPRTSRASATSWRWRLSSSPFRPCSPGPITA